MERGKKRGKGAHSCLEGAEGRPPGCLRSSQVGVRQGQGCGLSASQGTGEGQRKEKNPGPRELGEEGGGQTSSEQPGDELPKSPVCPLGEGLPPAQRAIRLWGITVWGEMGAHSAPFPRMSWGLLSGASRAPCPLAPGVQGLMWGKATPQALLTTPPTRPETVLISCGGRAAGLLDSRHRLPTRTRALPAVPAVGHRLGVRVRRAPGGGLNGDGEEPLDPLG